MKKKIFIAILLLVSKFGLTNLNYSSDTTFWRTTGSLVTFTEDEVKYGDATIFEDNRLIEYKKYNREITKHRIIYIKTQEGLSDNNKIVIHIPEEGSLLELKARSISADGKVVELNKDNIKEMKNYYQGGNLKMFAIEGAEVGGQIEYSYTVRTPLYDSGKEILSMDYVTHHALIMVGCYSKFRIGSKSFNWDCEEDVSTNLHIYEYKDIMPIAQEKYATPYANRVSVEHKLKGSVYGQTTFSNYRKVVAKKQVEFYTFEPKEINKAKKALKSFNKEAYSGEELIKKVTVFLKKKYLYKEDFSKAEYENTLAVMKSGVGNDRGIIKLYCVILKYLDIEYEVLISANKYYNLLDPKYCSRHSLTEYLIYFPKYDSYLYPAHQIMQYNLIPSWLIGNKALVVTEFNRSPKFVVIPDRDPEFNGTDLVIDVAIDLDDNSSVFSIKSFGTGLVSLSLNSAIYYSESEEEKEKELENFISWRYPESEILEAALVDPEVWGDIGACDDFKCKREYTAKVKSTSFYDVAGDKLLLKVGTLLGPQSELYSELERVQPITNSYNKSYRFNISIPIPDGYKYGGAQNADINNDFTDADGNKIAGFSSTVKIEDNVIKIGIYEFYAKVSIDKEYYEQFRKIINSAADFNKAIILLEKI